MDCEYRQHKSPFPVTVVLATGFADEMRFEAITSEARLHQVFSIYPAYISKAERKGRTRQEVEQVVCWLTGYDPEGLQRQVDLRTDVRTFFAQAPALNPNRSLIKGVVCGVRVEAVEDPLMQKIRQLDKLVDELAKGKAMEKILRQ
jgi:hypothetical protein